MVREGSVTPKERINVTFKPVTGGTQEEIELSLKLLAIGGYTQRVNEHKVEDRKPIGIGKTTFNEVLAKQEPGLTLSVPNRLQEGGGSDELAVGLQTNPMKDFNPASIVKQVSKLKKLVGLRDALVALGGLLGNALVPHKTIESVPADDEPRSRALGELRLSAAPSRNARATPSQGSRHMGTSVTQQGRNQSGEYNILGSIIARTRLSPNGKAYDIARRGASAFIEESFKPQSDGEPVKKAMVNRTIAEIGAKLSTQMDETLHHPDFQALESAWRDLQLLADYTNLRENIKTEILSVSKQDLLDDSEDSPGMMQSSLYKHIYTAEYDRFGGQPVGAITASCYMSSNSSDIKLTQHVSSVARMARAPFVTTADPKFFGLESLTDLLDLRDLKGHFKGPQFVKWQSFRQFEDSRHAALTVPRFLLRTLYDPEENPVKSFAYKETVANGHEHYLWGNTACAFGTKLADSFTRYRWCLSIIGPQSGGAVEDLPLHHFEDMDEIETEIPTEVLVSDRRKYEPAEEDSISPTMRRDSDNAVFSSANPVQKPEFFGINTEGKTAEPNYKLDTQLLYMMIINRPAHYLKVLQREQLGLRKERTDLELELNKQIRQYAADQENPSVEVHGRCPLRATQIIAGDAGGEPGWYRVSLNVRPYSKYTGVNFTLSPADKPDKK